MSTHFTKKKEISRGWLVVDAKDQVVGRVASQVAMFLMGKHKPTYSPHLDTGDYVIVINADKVKFTGKKWDDKKYIRHTGFVGGIKTRTAREMLAKKPGDILRIAVKGMLPKNHLARRQIMKLKIYTGNQHPHSVQNPRAVKIHASGKVIG
ncbi:MAG: 50S ribosomal protein L13 [Bdellovibrionales bacterium]|nr:50S ribosomal protein L13 [Bdellovibrionales bacterium]